MNSEEDDALRRCGEPVDGQHPIHVIMGILATLLMFACFLGAGILIWYNYVR